MTNEETNEETNDNADQAPDTPEPRRDEPSVPGSPPEDGPATAGTPPAAPDEETIRAELGISGGRRPIDPDHVEALLEGALEGCGGILAATEGSASESSSGEPTRLSQVGAGDLIDQNLELLRDVHLQVKVELGRGRMYLKDILRLGQGSVVELERLAGDPLDIYVNDKVIARGEVLVLNENFCIRITEVFNPEELRQAI